MSDKESRRSFLKTGASVAASVVVGSAVPASAQEPTAEKAVKDMLKAVPANNTAVLPDGRKLTRAEILTKLNLDPKTPPDAWLAIVGCGSNASALNFTQAQRLARRGVIEKTELEKIRTLKNP